MPLLDCGLQYCVHLAVSELCLGYTAQGFAVSGASSDGPTPHLCEVCLLGVNVCPFFEYSAISFYTRFHYAEQDQADLCDLGGRCACFSCRGPVLPVWVACDKG